MCRVSMKRILFLIFSVALLLLFISCSNQSNYEEEVPNVIRTKLEAIEKVDEEKYLSTIDESNKEYYNEQQRWIKDLFDNNIQNYNLEIISMDKIDDETVIVKIKQTYKYRYKNYDLTYDSRYIKGEDGWKDSDVNFNIRETEHFIVKYMEGDKNLDRMIDEIEKAYKRITDSYGATIKEKTVVKIYSDRELLRQCTKLSIPRQFTGWYEIGEGLKIFSGREKDFSYQGLVEHELTHKITLTASNNNMPYWLAEGVAVYFANFYHRGGDPIELGWYSKKDFNLSIDKLEKMDLEKMTKEYDVGRYYGVSAMIVKYMDLTYGKDKIKEIINELGKYPYNNNLNSNNWDIANQEKLRTVTDKVLGKSVDDLSNEWLEWLNDR